MKRILLLFCVVPLLSGCTIHNAWIIKGYGKDVKGAYQVASGEAGRIDAIFTRTFFFTTQKVDKELLDSLPGTKVIVDNDNKVKNIGIGK